MTKHDYVDPTSKDAIWRVCPVCEREFYTDSTKNTVCKKCNKKKRA